MILTHAGRLGLGITLPANDLHVVGTSTVTGLAYFGNNVEVKGDLSVDGFTATGTISIPALSADLTGNVNAQSGVSTFTGLKVNDGIGIGTDVPGGDKKLNIVDGASTIVTVDDIGSIGILTATARITGIDALESDVIISSVGVGTTAAFAPVDFYHAGRAGAATTTNRFMLLPTVTTVERGQIAATTIPPLGVGQTALGALIFNSTTKKIQFFNGDAWETVTSA